MGKAIKWTLIVIVGLVGLIAIAMVSLPFIINPNDYKEKISARIQEQTGRKLSIPGDIKLHVSPRMDVAFSLGEIHLASNSEFPDTPFASSKLAEIKLALWPLLTEKQLRINTIILKNVQLTLIRNKEGRSNWQDLAGTKGQPPAERKPGETKPVQPGQKSLAIDIGGVEATDINVEYLDQMTGRTVSLKNLNLNVGHLREGQPFPVKADFSLNMEDTKKEPLAATVETRGNLTLFLADQRYVLDDFKFNGEFQGKAIPSSKLSLELSANAEILAAQEKILLEKLSIKQGDLTAETSLTMVGFKNPTIDGTLNVPGYSPKAHMEQLGLPLPPFASADALSHLAASLGFRLDGNHLGLKDIKIELDGTKINGKASVDNLQHPAYQLTMHIDQMDLDRYAVKKDGKLQEKGEDTSEEETKKSEGNQPIIPVHLLRDLVFSADIKVDALKAAKLTTSDVVLQAEGKDGLIRLQPLTAKLYDGTLNVTGKIDARKEVPELQLQHALQHVQLGPMFVDMIGKEEFSGSANIQLDATTKGMDKDELIRNSNGSVKLAVADGRIAKLTILQTIRMAKALLEKKTAAPVATEQPTGFATLTASGRLTNGVFKNEDLLAESDLMKVTGKGSVDFVQEQVNYLLTVHLTDRIERDQETGLVELGNMPIPYRIQGSFTEIKQSADVAELAKAKAKEVLLDELQKHLKTDKNKDGSKQEIDPGSLINKGLKGLFGN